MFLEQIPLCLTTPACSKRQCSGWSGWSITTPCQTSQTTRWLVNHYALPPDGSGGTRHYTLARHLAPLGWRAIVIAASTELNTGRQRLGQGETKRFETIGDVEFIWLRAPSYQGNGVGRLVNMLVFSLRLLFLRGAPAPSVILGSSPHPFAALSAWWIARRKKIPFVYEVRDMWPQGLIELGGISARHPLMLLFGAIARFLFRRSDRFVAVMPGIVDYLAERNIPLEKFAWIPNGTDFGLFAAAAPPPSRTPFTFMFFGAHSTANGLEQVLQAMRMVETQGNDTRLRLIGDGPLKPFLMALAEQMMLKHVSFEPPVAKEAIPALAAQADAFIFPIADAPIFIKYGISANKLFDFLAAARPIIFACRSWNNPVAEAGAGLTAPPDDPAALAAAMLELASLPLEERQAMGARGRDYVLRNHSFTTLAEKLRDVLESLPNKGG